MGDETRPVLGYWDIRGVSQHCHIHKMLCCKDRKLGL